MSDFLKKGEELSKAGLLQILAEEAWRDGEVSTADSARIEALRKYLHIKTPKAMEILDVAMDKYRAGKIGSLRDFSARQCYARAMRYAYSDSPELSEKEAKYLQGLQHVLGMSDEDARDVFDRLSQKGWRPGTIDGEGGDSVVQKAADAARRRDPKLPAIEDPDGSVFADGDFLEKSVPPASGVPRPSGPSARPSEPVPLPPLRVPSRPIELHGPGTLPPAIPAPPRASDPVQSQAISHPAPAVARLEPVPPPAEPPPPPSARSRLPPAPEPAPARPPPSQARPPPSPPPPPSPAAGDDAAVPPGEESGSLDAPAPRVPRPTTRKKRQKGSSLRRSAAYAAQTASRVMFGAGILLFAVGLAGWVWRSLSTGPAPTAPGGSDLAPEYRSLAARFGANGFQVANLPVRGPEAPGGPPLDLGEAWDLSAGQDGFLYGTASYRIFRIDPKSGRVQWVAGNGRLGEPEEGKSALESMMDPASPRVDRDGELYFRQGSSAIFKVGKTGKLARIFGTRGARVAWKDGDKASEAKPGAVEQIVLDGAGRLFFDEYSGEPSGPEILGRIETDGKLRALFLFALAPVDHPYERLMKSFIGTGNGFENLEVGLDGGIYFTVGKKLYVWQPGAGPPVLLLPEAPVEYVVDKEGSLLVVVENRIERWKDVKSWTPEKRQVEVLAGGSPEGVPSVTYKGAIPAAAAGYMQPRDLTMGADGTLFVLDGAASGQGLSQPRVDAIRLEGKTAAP